MEQKNPVGAQAEPQEITYQVMPKSDGKYEPSATESAPAPKVPKAVKPPILPAPPKDAVMDLHPPLPSEHFSIWRNRWVYIIGGLLILTVLGYVIWSMTSSDEEVVTTKPVEQTTRLPKVWVQQYFNKEACDDKTICGDDADPDSDGLLNYDEFKAGTSPISSDTDADGLADGDEAHVYKTEPALKYTDRREVVSVNNWTDGFQIKNGYDPLTPALRFTQSRLSQIAEDIKKYPLNEPTLTTLNIDAQGKSKTPSTEQPAAVAPKNVAVVIENNKFDPVEVTVNVNDTVVWLNKDTTKHAISSTLSGLSSPDLSANQTYSFKFAAPGTYEYFDKLNSSVKAKVIVK